MLDSFEILTTSGVVLWSKAYTQIKPSLINSFIKDVFIEEKVLQGASVADDTSASQNPGYKKEGYTLRWASAVYQSLLHLTWIDKLLDNIRIIFTDLYGEQLRKPHTSVVECDFDGYFDQQVRELEGSAEKSTQGPPQIAVEDTEISPIGLKVHDALPPPLPGIAPGGQQKQILSNGASANSTPDTSCPSTPANNVLSASVLPKGASRRARKAAVGAFNTASSGDERKPKSRKDASKKMRRWNDEGMVDEDDGAMLDYSAQSDGGVPEAVTPNSITNEAINAETAGTRTNKGQFVLKDLDSEVHSMLQSAEDRKTQQQPTAPKSVVVSSLGAISGLFRNVIGGKVLTKEDLEEPMKGMEEHLLKKNVAREAAVRLCEGVERELIGVKTGSFELCTAAVEATIRSSMESSLRKILTPTTSLDILRSITSVISSPKATPSLTKSRPYVISIVGVNGVGKSTNLSKLAFFLIQNKFSLLIAACDTFRSGAVEQLRVHARNLQELSEREGLGTVELYERGYGKDAANIAKDAVAYAATNALDVVLIDTAGRRHNDTRLMSSLEKFAQFAKPDKILMVGEALVGSDSVAQARAFNRAFGAQTRLDGFIISKCDTVGDMVGSLVSMVHATGIPVVFLGVGQHYGDLRTLNVSWAVKMLMS
ncbi:MAG: hypothetical protein Q9217_000650 [Psora testacea]